MPPPTSLSDEYRIAPPSTIEALAVVPPMSSVIRSGRSSCAPRRAAAITPAAGPDSIAGARPQELPGRGLDRALVERDEDLAGVVDPLVDLEPQRALDQRARLLPERVVEARDTHAADLEQVAEAAGRQQAGAGAAVLEDR